MLSRNKQNDGDKFLRTAEFVECVPQSHLIDGVKGLALFENKQYIVVAV